MKRPTLWIAFAILAALITAGTLWWRAASRTEAIRSGVPARPDLAGWPDDLATRIAAIEQRVLSGIDAVRALGELGRIYHANGFYAEASTCYHALLSVDPKNPRAPHAFAAILAGYGKLDEAASLWRRTLDLAPDYMPARIRLGDVLLKANRLDAAAEVYAEALRRDPQQPYAHLGMGRIHLAAGRWQEARAPLEKAASLSNDRLAIDVLPTVYERLGDTMRAEELRGRNRAAGTFADTPDPWLDEMMLECYDTYRLAVAAGAAAHGGDRRIPILLLERALKISPDSAPVHFQIGKLFLENKEYTRARPHLEQCTRLAPDMADGWIHLSILLATVGDRAGSERILAEGIARNPASPGLHLERAHRLAASGRPEEAIAEYQESLRLRPDEAAPAFSIAKIYFETGRTDEAVAELRRALAIEPDFPPALSVLAFQAIQAGDASAAREWLARIRLQPRVTRPDRERLEAAFREQFGASP